ERWPLAVEGRFVGKNVGFRRPEAIAPCRSSALLRRASAPVLEEPPCGEGAQFGCIPQLQLCLDAPAVSIHRRFSQAQPPGNLGRVESFADKLENFQLAICQ